MITTRNIGRLKHFYYAMHLFIFNSILGPSSNIQLMMICAKSLIEVLCCRILIFCRSSSQLLRDKMLICWNTGWAKKSISTKTWDQIMDNNYIILHNRKEFTPFTLSSLMMPDLDNWYLFYYFLPVTLNPYFGNWHLFYYILHILFNPIRPRKSSPNHSFSPKKSRFAFQTEAGKLKS